MNTNNAASFYWIVSHPFLHKYEEKASKRVDVVRVKLCLYHVSDCLYIFGKTDLGKILDSHYRYTTNTKDIIAVVIMGKMSAGNRRTLDDWTNRYL